MLKRINVKNERSQGLKKKGSFNGDSDKNKRNDSIKIAMQIKKY